MAQGVVIPRSPRVGRAEVRGHVALDAAGDLKLAGHEAGSGHHGVAAGVVEQEVDGCLLALSSPAPAWPFKGRRENPRPALLEDDVRGGPGAHYVSRLRTASPG